MSTPLPLPPDDPADAAPPTSPDPVASRDEILDRAKDVAKRIEERVRKLTADTDVEHRALPTDDTETNPPVP